VLKVVMSIVGAIEEVLPEDFDSEDQATSLHREEEGGGGHTTAMENEKRMRREIANSNERRRMQSINAGFQSLRSLLPHHEGEKLSKVSGIFKYYNTFAYNISSFDLILSVWQVSELFLIFRPIN